LDDNGAVALAAELINGGQTIAARNPSLPKSVSTASWMAGWLLCIFTEISALAAQAFGVRRALKVDIALLKHTLFSANDVCTNSYSCIINFISRCEQISELLQHIIIH
jgi:hypothetical protein